ncbi:Ribosome biogenesis protein WDR12 -like protein [Caligus rogercresseyi]|uniref:Ribosome biogenesis protein WDR12 -like protein n=1 Tax=Caligus rogercresseyi TaxID=217165 RepID=A0A7T8KGV8_CALRO|nr:Ribosome biogenesis protein WDR12 -like protein [Caligus rogercresseyi]
MRCKSAENNGGCVAASIVYAYESIRRGCENRVVLVGDVEEGFVAHELRAHSRYSDIPIFDGVIHEAERSVLGSEPNARADMASLCPERVSCGVTLWGEDVLRFWHLRVHLEFHL